MLRAGRPRRPCAILEVQRRSRQRGDIPGLGRSARLCEQIIKRSADCLFIGIPKDARCGRIDRDAAISVNTNEAVTDRHRDIAEAAFGGAREQSAQIDLLQRDRQQITRDGRVKWQGIEDQRRLLPERQRSQFDCNGCCGRYRADRAIEQCRNSAVARAPMPKRPNSVNHGEFARSSRFCSSDSTASACSTGPETSRPFGTLNRSPSSSAVPPTMTFSVLHRRRI